MTYRGLLLIASALFILPANAALAASIPQSITPAATSPATAEQLGDLSMARQDYPAAIKYYEQAPSTAITLDKIGVAYNHMQQLDEAAQKYEQALTINHDYPDAINNLGAVYFFRGDYKQAIRLYKNALKLMPTSAIFAENLGTAYFARHQYEQGMNAYTKAFTIDPNIFSRDSLSRITRPASLSDLAREDFCIAELLAQAGMKNNAIIFLRKSLNEGLKDRGRILDDSAFNNIRQTPEFAQLLTQEKIRN